MTTGPSGGDAAWRQRRSARLALFRALLSLAYVAAGALLPQAALTKTGVAVIGVFIAYSVLLLVWRSHRLVRTQSLSILFLDLVFLLLLMLRGGGPFTAALPAVFYAFLVLESWSLQGGREVVLLATAVILVLYQARLAAGQVRPMVVSVPSVLFLLVVGGLLAFLISERRYNVERRLLNIAHQARGASETATAAAMEEALKELAAWFRCSRALLAFWDARSEHCCLCRYPPAEGRISAAATAGIDDSREWFIFQGERLTFLAPEIASTETPSGPVETGYDLHPQLLQKFQIRNAISCALEQEGRTIGRLLLVNCIAPSRRWLRRLVRVAPAFSDLAGRVLVLKAVEDAASERERSRIAQDFHDGPLQSVISFQMRVHTIRKLLERDPAAATRELAQLQELARKEVTEMRTFVNSMRPLEADSANLTAAARRLVDDFQKESGVPVTFLSGEEPVSTPGKTGVDILQLIREALHNIHKHAHATHVVFSLEKTSDHLVIAVNDNGQGFRFGGRYSLEELESLRLGPNSIKQRMRGLGGDLLLESQPGHGTNLRLRIPLH